MDAIVTQSVFFTTGLIVAAIVAMSLSQGVSEVVGGLEVHSDAIAAEMRSAVRVVSDPVNVPNNPVKLYVKNTGLKELLPDEFLVLVDGQARPDADVAHDVLDTAEDRVLPVGKVVLFTLNNLNLAAGDHVAKVVADTGVSDTFAFKV